MTAPADRRDPVLQAMARNALDFAIKNQFAEAGAAVQRLGNRFGGDGAVQAGLLWIDTLGAHLGAKQDGQPVALLFKAVETGEIGGADGTRPAVAWAGQLIAARLADDEATFVALINVAGSRADFGAYIGELLHVIALTFRTNPGADLAVEPS